MEWATIWVIAAPIAWIIGVVIVASFSVWRAEKRKMKDSAYRIQKAYEADRERQNETSN